MSAYLGTGQTKCYDAAGRPIPCEGTGQDGALRRGAPWPVPRFVAEDGCATDRLTGLMWPRDASVSEFPLSWAEALDFVARMNRERAFGHGDWRLPNRRELRSLMDYQTRAPALPEGHPFKNIFSGWYWTSTTAVISPSHAWYLHMEGARMFYGGKDQSFFLWPVRGPCGGVLPATGQTKCYDAAGRPMPCEGTGQDGALRRGAPWPVPRFEARGEEVRDRLTGLCWRRCAEVGAAPLTWAEALARAAALMPIDATRPWRLPNINELESLVDAGQARPALPAGHPFACLHEGYWSSTTSAFEPDWAWALYLEAGAVGVGQKKGAHFHAWAVSGGAAPPVRGWMQWA